MIIWKNRRRLSFSPGRTNFSFCTAAAWRRTAPFARRQHGAVCMLRYLEWWAGGRPRRVDQISCSMCALPDTYDDGQFPQATLPRKPALSCGVQRRRRSIVPRSASSRRTARQRALHMPPPTGRAIGLILNSLTHHTTQVIGVVAASIEIPLPNTAQKS